MSLYLTIFDGDEEVTGWVFGHYSDFGYFRDVIALKLSEGTRLQPSHYQRENRLRKPPHRACEGCGFIY